MKANGGKAMLDFMTLELTPPKICMGRTSNPSLIKSIINTAELKHVIGMHKTTVRRNIDVQDYRK